MNARKLVFSKTSKIIHTVWFVSWFALHLSINLLTLVVSLEAIYLELFLGDNDQDIDADQDKHSKLIEEIHRKVHQK